MSNHGFWGTRILDPLLVRSLEPKVLAQVLHRARVFPVERVEYEDVGAIPERVVRFTTRQTSGRV